KYILKTDNSSTTIIIRLMVGVVFLSEGIQKFLFAEKLGVGRFDKIGLPNPEFLGPFVGSCEMICGALVLLGLLTRLAAIPLFASCWWLWLRPKPTSLPARGSGL